MRELLFHQFLETPERLDTFLMRHLVESGEDISRTAIQKVIAANGVAVNNQVAKKPGMTIVGQVTVSFSPPVAPPKDIVSYDIPLDRLYEDEYIVVVNKPAGLAVHPGAGNSDKTLINALVGSLQSSADEFPDPVRPGIVHRLDKDTTGLLVVAKTPSALANLSKQFASRAVERRYVVLVGTTPRANREVQCASDGRIETLHGRDPKNRERFTVLPSGGRLAVTNWTVRETFAYGSLLEVRLETGRTHQIRVHMAWIRSPVVGDLVYGDHSFLPPSLKKLAQEFGRQALHAESLGFVHPITQKRLFFSAPMPAEMGVLVDSFRKAGP